jgi:hypothetical protein
MNTPRLILDPAKLLLLGGCLLPVLVVQGARSLTNTPSAPTAASADATIAPAEAETEPAARPAPAAASRASMWLAERTPARSAPSPMDAPPAPEPVGMTAPSEPEPIIEPSTTVPDAPSLRVTSIVGTVENAVAMINAKVRRVGESPAEGWTITRIDASEQRVVITGPAGQILTLTPPRR